MRVKTSFAGIAGQFLMWVIAKVNGTIERLRILGAFQSSFILTYVSLQRTLTSWELALLRELTA